MNNNLSPEERFSEMSEQELLVCARSQARRIAELERVLSGLQNALRLIGGWGGGEVETEVGVLNCNGAWCAEQARSALGLSDIGRPAPEPKDDQLIFELHDAAREVIERWETPVWKDVPATAVYINRLRNAVNKMTLTAISATSETGGSLE